MKKYEKLSDNSIGELLNLMADIKKNLDDYLHVTDYLPLGFIKMVDKVQSDILKEYDFRNELNQD